MAAYIDLIGAIGTVGRRNPVRIILSCQQYRRRSVRRIAIEIQPSPDRRKSGLCLKYTL